MEGNIERDCSVLGGLFQAIINDMKNSVPIWEDFSSKATKLHSQLKTTIVCIATFLESFQRLADVANNSRGATKELGAALTRLTLRHKTIELKLKSFTTSIMECLVIPLQERMEDWRKITAQLDKEHAKEYKKARQDIKKKSTDTLRLQKKARKGKTDVQYRLDSAMQDVNDMYILLEEAEKNAVRNSLVEERSRFCMLVTFLRPVVEEEISMLSEVTQLQSVLEELSTKSKDPYVLPSSSEQVILDIKGQDGSKWSFPTPPSSPTTSTGSRKSSMCSLSSINSSDSRSSGSMNSHSPSNHYHRHRSMSQPNPSHRLSSVSSQDSGFTSQDTLFLRPGTPPQNEMMQGQRVSPTESPIEEQPGQSSSECSTPSPGFPHPSGGFPTPTPTSAATTPVIGGPPPPPGRVAKPVVPLPVAPIPGKTQTRPAGPVRRHSEVSLRSQSSTLRSPSSMPNFDHIQPNQTVVHASATLPRKQAKRLKLPAFCLLPRRFKLMRSPRHDVQVELKQNGGLPLNTPLATPSPTPLASPVVPRPVYVNADQSDSNETTEYRNRSATLPNRRHTTIISPVTSSLEFALARGLGSDPLLDGALEADKSSHKSLPCSSGYNTQSTTPAHSEDTINSQDTDYYSMDGDGSMEQTLLDYEKTATIPRTGDPSHMYTGRQRPMSMACVPSTISEASGMISPQGTLRRKPPPPIRRTPSGGSLTGMDLASSQYDTSGQFKVPLPVNDGRSQSGGNLSQPEFIQQQKQPPPKASKPVGRSQSLRVSNDPSLAMGRLSLMESLNAKLAQRQTSDDSRSAAPATPPPVASKPSMKGSVSQSVYQQPPSFSQGHGQITGYQPNAFQQQQPQHAYQQQQQQPNAYQQIQQHQYQQQNLPPNAYQSQQQSAQQMPYQQQSMYSQSSPTHKQRQQQVQGHSYQQQQTSYQQQQPSAHYQQSQSYQQPQQQQIPPYQQQMPLYQQQMHLYQQQQQPTYQQSAPYVQQPNTAYQTAPVMQQSVVVPEQKDSDSEEEEDTGTGILSEIKRGVKLRRTSSNDRSAPKLLPTV